MMNETVLHGENNISAQILLLGAQELLGTGSLPSFLNGYTCQGKQLFQETGVFLRGLEETYGTPGGRGLALRLGRSVFRYTLQQMDEQNLFRTMNYRILPSPQRIEKGLHALAHLVAGASAGEISIADAGTHWVWRSEQCAVCANYHSSDPCCYLTVGLLQEFATWAGGGRFYRVVETECRAMGAEACVFTIDKRPLD